MHDKFKQMGQLGISFDRCVDILEPENDMIDEYYKEWLSGAFTCSANVRGLLMEQADNGNVSALLYLDERINKTSTKAQDDKARIEAKKLEVAMAQAERTAKAGGVLDLIEQELLGEDDDER